MKRILAVLALLVALGSTAGAAQTRVSVSIGFGAPYVAYHPRHYHQPYIVYYPRSPLIVIGRPAYRQARVIVVPRRHHIRRHRHYHGWR